MSVVSIDNGMIVRANVARTEFFTKARAALVAAGAKETAWVDYLLSNKGLNLHFITIRSSRIAVEAATGERFTTTKIQRVVDLINS